MSEQKVYENPGENLKLLCEEEKEQCAKILLKVDLTEWEAQPSYELCTPVQELGQGHGCTIHACVRKKDAATLRLRLKLGQCAKHEYTNWPITIEWTAAIKSINTLKYKHYETKVSTFVSPTSDEFDDAPSQDLEISLSEIEGDVVNCSMFLKWNVKLLRSMRDIAQPRRQLDSVHEMMSKREPGIGHLRDSGYACRSLTGEGMETEIPIQSPDDELEPDIPNQLDVSKLVPFFREQGEYLDALYAATTASAAISKTREEAYLRGIGRALMFAVADFSSTLNTRMSTVSPDSDKRKAEPLVRPLEPQPKALTFNDSFGIEEQTNTDLSEPGGDNVISSNNREGVAIAGVTGEIAQPSHGFGKDFGDVKVHMLNKIELSEFESRPMYEHVIPIHEFGHNRSCTLQTCVRKSAGEIYAFRLQITSCEKQCNFNWPLAVKWKVGLRNKRRETVELARSFTSFERPTVGTSDSVYSQDLQATYDDIKDFITEKCILLMFTIKILSSTRETRHENHDDLRRRQESGDLIKNEDKNEDYRQVDNKQVASEEIAQYLFNLIKDKCANILTKIDLSELDDVRNFENSSPIQEIGESPRCLVQACVRKSNKETLCLRIKLNFCGSTDSLKRTLGVEWRVAVKGESARKSEQFETMQWIFDQPKFESTDWTSSQELKISINDIKNFIFNDSILTLWKIKLLRAEQDVISPLGDDVLLSEGKLKTALDHCFRFFPTGKNPLQGAVQNLKQRPLQFQILLGKLKSFQRNVDESNRRTVKLLSVFREQSRTLNQLKIEVDDFVDTRSDLSRWKASLCLLKAAVSLIYFFSCLHLDNGSSYLHTYFNATRFKPSFGYSKSFEVAELEDVY